MSIDTQFGGNKEKNDFQPESKESAELSKPASQKTTKEVLITQTAKCIEIERSKLQDTKSKRLEQEAIGDDQRNEEALLNVLDSLEESDELISRIHRAEATEGIIIDTKNELVPAVVSSLENVLSPSEYVHVCNIFAYLEEQGQISQLVDDSGSVNLALLSMGYDQAKASFVSSVATGRLGIKPQLDRTESANRSNITSYEITKAVKGKENFKELNERQKESALQLMQQEIDILRTANTAVYHELTQNLDQTYSVATYAHQLLPNHPHLADQIILENPDKIPARELIAICLFEKIIENQTAQIEQSIHTDNYANAQNEDEKAAQLGATDQLLIDTGIREEPEDQQEKAAIGLSLDDYRRINEQLSSITDPEERGLFLDQFIQGMAEITGRSTREQRTIFENHIGQIQGLDTLKATFENLKSDGRVGKIITDEGTINTELFTEYYDQAFETVSQSYQPVTEYLSRKRSEERIQQGILNQEPVEVQIIPLDKAKQLPQVARLIENNAMLNQFINDNAEISIQTLPDDSSLLNIVYDRDNTAHSLTAAFPLDIAHPIAKLSISGEDPVYTQNNPYDFQRDSQSLISYHLIKESGLGNLFPTESRVDKVGTEDRNDPRQLVSTILGDDFFNDGFPTIEAALIEKYSRNTALAFGEDFADLDPDSQRRRVREVGEQLGVSFIDDEAGVLSPAGNLYLRKVAEITDPYLVRVDKIDDHGEVVEYFMRLKNGGREKLIREVS